MNRTLLSSVFCGLWILSLFAHRDSSGASGVELISMSAIPSQVVVHLKWEVLEEREGVTYVVEKSVDGMNWVERSRRSSLGSSETYRTYLESLSNFPERSVELFRLRAIDGVGNSEVLQQTVVRHPVLSEIRLLADQKDVYNTVTLTFESLEEVKAMVTVWDLNGRVRYFKRHQCELGYNRRILPVSALEPGVYRVVVDDEQGHSIAKTLTIHKRLGRR